MFLFPISVSVDLVPTDPIKAPLGYFLVILLLELILARQDAAPQGRVGVECNVVVAEAREELLLYLPGHQAVHPLVHAWSHPVVGLVNNVIKVPNVLYRLTLQTFTTSDTSQEE